MNGLTKTLAIARRDLSSAFNSPVAYVVTAAFAVVSGLMFVQLLYNYNYDSAAIMAQSMGSPEADEMLGQLNVVELVIAPLLGNVHIIFLFMMPLVTMRLLSEEKRNGTDELLFTSPLTVNQIVVGKCLAGLGLVAATIAPTLLPVATLFIFGNLPWKVVLSGYLGVLLVGAAFIALGLFASSLTENQIIAAVIGFALFLTIYIVGWSGDLLGDTSTVGKLLKYVSIGDHAEDFTRGIIDSQHVIYFLSLTFFGLFLTARVLESRRWR